jgi:serine protease Do
MSQDNAKADPNVPHAVPQRRRGIVVASALALALMGGVATQALLPGSTPALAQNLTEEAQPHAQQIQGNYPSFADIIQTVKPAVLSVKVKADNIHLSSSSDDDGDMQPFGNPQPGSPLDRFFKRFQDELGRNGQRSRPQQHHFVMGQGSGFIISEDGYAVTNNHVVENAEDVQVTTDDGSSYPAKVVGTDARTDLALLKIDAGKKLPFVRFAHAAPRVGDWVLAVGNPFGLGGTVTAGIISARGRDIGAGPYDDFLQIDAAVNRGNSGGPTFHLNGEVVGVNTAIYSPSGGNVGIAFAIPAEVATDIVASLKDNGTVTRGWLGVQIQPVTQELADSLGLKGTEGALVADTQADSPASKVGIKSGDTIEKVNGDTVPSPRELSRRIAAMKPGASVDLTVMRDGKERTVTVQLGKLPEQQQEASNDQNADKAPQTEQTAKLGVEIAPAGKVDGAGKDGVVVTNVDPDGAAAGKLREGDVILEIAGKAVQSTADVSQGLRDAQKDGKKTVLLRVKTGDATRFVAVTVGHG